MKIFLIIINHFCQIIIIIIKFCIENLVKVASMDIIIYRRINKYNSKFKLKII